ncbi:MerR family transcriptional regulator [Streptomyces drozdowiczii]|uniref:MerR family transcriptional regulator n=1 Tax=Streptomyces drozdowiczii TaxID=202862 RepID=A0ABY6PY98_9ACTN|nr:MerR family transcriptional regulator [Streptomyces drozdowiczii]MCX0242690.1 MerR family transcriptional regulator [Streptomyces drozdowiczii]UZK57290.1 MerR family transcriptional regulator [Streptomyces drozdowiczii]
MLIGEVARRSGVSARMLRHYESLGLVRPTGRNDVGYREYSGEDVRRIFHIESLRSLGLSLREVGRALDDPGFSPAGLVDDLVRRTRERIASETELLTRLSRIGAAGPEDWEGVLRTVALLQDLGSSSPGTRQRAALSSGGEAPVEALVEAVLSERDPSVAGALRWALARAGGGLDLLAEGLDSPVAAVRARAVRAVAGIPGEAASALLRDALGHPDVAVRRYAAPALGARGVAEAVPTLIGMVAEAVRDVDAADALGALAADPETAERIASALVGRLADPALDAPARRRLTQALADILGPTATRALGELAEDGDRGVAVTAVYLLGLREG